MTDDHSRRARAFNRGADSRLNGEPLSSNPYTGRDGELHAQWRKGWKHANLQWGIDAKECAPLPQMVTDLV